MTLLMTNSCNDGYFIVLDLSLSCYCFWIWCYVFIVWDWRLCFYCL